MAFIHNVNLPLEMVDIIYNINSFGWIGFGFFSLWFAAIYTDNKKMLKQKWFLIIFLLIPLILIYKKWTGEIIDYYILMPYGWAHVWKDSFWTYIFYSFYFVTIITTVFVYFNYWKKTRYIIQKKQAKIMIISIFASLISGSILSVVLPELNNNYFPSIGDLCALFWVFGIVYAMSKYNFLNITPETIASNIISTMSDALVILDRDGYVVSVNKATLELLKYREKELLNQSISFLLASNGLRSKILSKAKKGEVFKNENLIFKTKGSIRNVPVIFSNSLLKNIDNSIAGIVCIFKNISENKKIEKELENKNKELENSIEKLEKSKLKINNAIDKIDREKRNIDLEKNKISSIISSFKDPVIVIDKYSRISYINAETKNIFGFSDNIIGRKYFLRNFSMSNLKVVSKVGFSVSKGNELISGDTREEVEELAIHDKKRDLAYKVITVKMMEDSDYFGLIKIFHNLTKEKEMDKLKSEFISIAAHQLRTPLSAVKWVLKMILDGDAGKLLKSQSELLEKGYSNNERMIKLVNDLLFVSRIEEGRFGYTFKDDDYLSVIKTSLVEQEKLCKLKNINLSYDAPEKLPKINIDRDRIGLVLKNIFSNCRKYVPENGKIKLTVLREEEFIKTIITDNGMGIPKKEEKRLFEKFFRATNVLRTQTSGTGLGLYITKNIIKKHGGEIIIKSKEGKGTEVVFTLPIKKYQNFNI